jgi:predicted nucleic acid-binding protein
MKRILIDTNVYIDWMNQGKHEAFVVGPGLVRHLSSVVLMELEAGATTRAARSAAAELARAFDKVGRIAPPSREVWARTGAVLRGLQAKGREIRRASLVHDVLIALTARDIGATLITRDVSDHAAIRKLVDFSYAVVS